MPRSSQHRSSATHREEKQAIRDGRILEDWKEKPAKLAQKDCDARWTIKYTKAKPKEDGVPQVDLAIPAFGYKNHIAIDRAHGLIRKWTATHAAAKLRARGSPSEGLGGCRLAGLLGAASVGAMIDTVRTRTA